MRWKRSRAAALSIFAYRSTKSGQVQIIKTLLSCEEGRELLRQINSRAVFGRLFQRGAKLHEMLSRELSGQGEPTSFAHASSWNSKRVLLWFVVDFDKQRAASSAR